MARIRVKTTASPGSPEPPDLPLPTISPTSSRDDLSVLGSRRFTTLASHRSFWLVLYFALNLTLTLYNKAILISFPFPYTLTAIHSFCAAFGGRVLLRYGVYRPKRLSFSDHAILALFSILYSVNIAVSNASLELVTVPMHQVVRGTTPLFTTVLAYLLLSIRVTPAKLAALVPVVAGVGFATYGDYSATLWGLSLTLLGALLASLKTVTTNLLQTRSPSRKLKKTNSPAAVRMRLFNTSVSIPVPRVPKFNLSLHPLDLLTRMSPYAFTQCIVYAHLSGELAALSRGNLHVRLPEAYNQIADHVVPWSYGYPLVLAANGALAFALNVVSFEANRRAGAVSMGVASNVKQVLTILSAVSFFHLSISRINAAGILLTLLGGTWYAFVESAERRRA